MKCPSCSYFNLPGLTQCSSCGLSFQSASDGPPQPAAWGEVLPPRARNRNSTQKVEQGLGRPYRRSRAALQSAQRNFQQVSVRNQNQILDMQLSLRDWSLILAALIPGAAQLITKRWPIAAVFTTAFFCLLIALRLSFYNAFFTQFLYSLLILVVASVWETANFVSPPAPEGKEFFRVARLISLSTGLVSSLGFFAMLIFNHYYDSAQIYNDANASNPKALIKNGDYILVRHFNGIKNLQRGDVVLADYQCDRVLGLPGDHIEGKDGKIWVNGAPVLKSKMPFLFVAPAPDFDVTVRADAIVLWQQILVMRANAPVNIVPYRVYDADEVLGRVIAIHAPAQRRQWVR